MEEKSDKPSKGGPVGLLMGLGAPTKPSKDEALPAPAEETDLSDPESLAAEGVMDAFESKDPIALREALRTFVQAVKG